MNDYISRAAAKAVLKQHEHRFTCADEANGIGNVKWSEYVVYSDTAQNCIDAIPAADVRPVVRGKDIWKSHDSHCEFKCSVCGAWAGEVAGGTLDGGPFNFCPNCGAKLEVDNE